MWPYSQNELKSDRFLKDYTTIARLSRHYDYHDGLVDRSVYLVPNNSGIARELLNEYEEIVDLTRMIPQEGFEAFRQGFDEDVFITIISNRNRKEFFR